MRHGAQQALLREGSRTQQGGGKRHGEKRRRLQRKAEGSRGASSRALPAFAHTLRGGPYPRSETSSRTPPSSATARLLPFCCTASPGSLASLQPASVPPLALTRFGSLRSPTRFGSLPSLQPASAPSLRFNPLRLPRFASTRLAPSLRINPLWLPPSHQPALAPSLRINPLWLPPFVLTASAPSLRFNRLRVCRASAPIPTPVVRRAAAPSNGRSLPNESGTDSNT